MKKFIMNNWKKILIVIGAAFIIYNVSKILSTGSTVLDAYKDRGLVVNENKSDDTTQPDNNNDQKEETNNNSPKEENNNEGKQEENNNPNNDNLTHDVLPNRD